MPDRVTKAERERSWFRGDCHVHSTVSTGGELTPEQLVRAARAVGLDFLAATEHNTSETHEAWSRHSAGDLLVIPGQEVTTLTGHWLALGIEPRQRIEWRYGVRDDRIGRWVDDVRRVGGLCVAAHPHAPYPSGTLMYPYQAFDVVEVWNGPWTSGAPWQADNEAALAEWGRGLAAGIHQGRWLPAMGNSDTRLEGQIGIPHTVVSAKEPSTAALLSAIRAGRSWIAGSATAQLSFTVSADGRSAGIGERLATVGAPALAGAVVHGVPSGTVSFHTERGEAYRSPLDASGAGSAELVIGAADSAFVRVEVRHREGHMAALSNPVMLD
ncbi:CehA/McbA family metallohydrolase [Streptomyces sp. NPDC006288]|uniref:CehA/McbA family metallohydrolase n=1 Tax=Streptomyces sp. NPDC006288 TaxID=3156743 RepID=UPI0033A3E67B